MPVLVLSDTRFRVFRTPVPVCLRRPFMHLWTPVRAFVGRPYPYPCVRALGGNFIIMRTVPCVQRCLCGTDCRRSTICRDCCEEPRRHSHELAAAGCAVYDSVGGVSRGHAGGSQVTPAFSGAMELPAHWIRAKPEPIQIARPCCLPLVQERGAPSQRMCRPQTQQGHTTHQGNGKPSV